MAEGLEKLDGFRFSFPHWCAPLAAISPHLTCILHAAHFIHKRGYSLEKDGKVIIPPKYQ